MIRSLILRALYFVISILHIAVSFVVGISSWVFYLIAGLFLAVTICCYIMGIESGDGIKQMLISCGILFAIPLIANFIEAILDVAVEAIGDKL